MSPGKQYTKPRKITKGRRGAYAAEIASISDDPVFPGQWVCGSGRVPTGQTDHAGR